MTLEPEPARRQLAGKVASLIGTAESMQLAVPGLTIYRHAAPTEAYSSTYQPSIALVAQGRKQVDLGQSRFVYDESHFLLTSLDLPVTSRVIQASAGRPYLCVRLAFDMAMVRELLASLPAVVVQAMLLCLQSPVLYSSALRPAGFAAPTGAPATWPAARRRCRA